MFEKLSKTGKGEKYICHAEKNLKMEFQFMSIPNPGIRKEQK